MLLIFSFVFFVLILIKLFLFWRKIHSKQIILEISPLRKTEQIPYTTQELFSLIHGLAKQRSFFQRIIGERKNYSFEIVSSKEKGIRYLIRVNEEDASIIKHELLAYLSGTTIKEVDDYLEIKENLKNLTITEFKLANHFSLPLKGQNSLEDNDPIAYITGAMTKLEANEFISFQLVTTPLQKSLVKDIDNITSLIYNHNELSFNLRYLKAGYLVKNIFKLFLLLIINIVFLPIGLLIFLFTEGREGPFISSVLRNRQKKVDNIYQQELETQIKSKLDQPLFVSTIRLLVTSPSKKTRKLRVKGVLASLESFSNLNYQSLRKKRQLNFSFIKLFNLFLFKNRLHRLFNKSFLSVTEVADIYHLPFTSTTKTENLVKQQSKELAPPLSLKQSDELDVYFGQNNYGGVMTKIGLTADERRRHMYIIGATGVGKSTLLLSMIKQDIDNNKGIAVIDPHGDLIEKR
ncbi:MAG: DUF87 domain-containing protein, partial [Candidatus Shapirobacteria bacterium]|nr:DUF87 domain-containing protein [Candidatus Shapirobacteria bacterium]